MTSLLLTQLNQHAQNIYCDNKDARKQARAALIKETNSFQNIQALIGNDLSAYPQLKTLLSIISNLMAGGDFPCSIDTTKAGKISNTFTLPDSPLIDHSQFDSSAKPGYIVTMPHHPKIGLPNPTDYILNQMKMLEGEGFGADAAASRLEAPKRLAVVIGLNYCHSLDTKRNKQFKRCITEIANIATTHMKIMAFNWNPLWKNGESPIEQKLAKRLFRLLADANPEKAEVVFNKVMQGRDKIIPYQSIRNEIKNSPFVASYYTALKHGQKNRPVCMHVTDDDTVCRRTDGMGLFSHYDQLIALNPNLQVASTGYYMQNPVQQFVEFASVADLIARRAIACTLPNGAYLPEPNCVVVIKSKEDLAHRISFLRKGANKGKGLEFLGLMENLGLNKGDVTGQVVMGQRGAIITAQPPRATVSEHIPDQLTSADLNNARILSGLRGFFQSVLNPKKGLAQNVARAMPKGTGSAVNTGQITYLYTAFDPIDYIKVTTCWMSAYSSIVNSIVTIYNVTVKGQVEQPNFNVRANTIVTNCGLPASKVPEIAQLLQAKFTHVWNARVHLIDTNKCLTEEQFRLLFVTVLNVNSAIYTFIRSRIENTPFVFPQMLN